MCELWLVLSHLLHFKEATYMQKLGRCLQWDILSIAKKGSQYMKVGMWGVPSQLLKIAPLYFFKSVNFFDLWQRCLKHCIFCAIT